jgi:hypothetical protein
LTLELTQDEDVGQSPGFYVIKCQVRIQTSEYLTCDPKGPRGLDPFGSHMKYFVLSFLVRVTAFSGTVGYATTNDPTTNECYNKQFLSIKSECYNECGAILAADVARACA